MPSSTMLATFKTSIALVTSISSLCGAHLILQEPVPYSQDTLDNSPLINAAPGTAESNFPCKLRANAFEVTKENMITVGQSNTMTWKGSASHGGGTCQLSVTMDRAPTADSTFKVIDSWIGGCPTNSDGNGGTIPFNWTLPAEIPNGKSTLAWSWVSKLSGQPEYYMNCAPMTVTGGASNTDEYDKLEDLFKVNLPSSNCGSQLSHDLEIPNPGKYVTTFASDALATPTGSGCAAMGQASATEGSQSGGGASSADGGSTEGSPTATAAPTAGTTGTSLISLAFPSTTASAGTGAASSGASGSSNSSSSGTDSGSSGAGEAGSSGEAPTPQTGSSSSSSQAGSNGTSSGGSTGGTGTCTTNGAVVCNGESQFGLCNFGTVVWQAVADGTTCSNGQIQKRGVQRSSHVRHPHVRHI